LTGLSGGGRPVSRPRQPVVFDGSWTLNQTIAAYPATVAVFNRFGVDACCGGSATIEAAAARDGLDAGAILEALRQEAGLP
jgi:iron-sulfur cluster repair protein YtfE (RIC family)